MFSEAVTRNVRLGRGGALLAGAAIYALLVYGPLQFYWTPLLLGLAYLGAAAAGGRRGGLWATALVLTGWGVGVLLATKLDSVSSGDGYLMGVGGAIVVAGVLARSGFAIDLVSVGGTVLIAGILHNAAGDPVQALVKPWPYVALLAGVGALNLVLALAPRRRPASSSARTTPKQSGVATGQASPTI